MRRTIPSRPSRCCGKKVRFVPMNSSKNWILPSRSLSSRPRHLGEPVEERGEDPEHRAGHEHVVQVRDDPVCVLDMEVERHDGQERAVEPADQEQGDEAQGEQQRRVEASAGRPTSSPAS